MSHLTEGSIIPEKLGEMTAPQFVLCQNPSGYHKVSYREWGNKDSKVLLITVHGLTGNSTDFTNIADYLAKHKGYRVVSIDIIGRGNSDWLENKSYYNLNQYAQDVMSVYSRVSGSLPSDGKSFYLGTSMGGLIGMFIAQYPTNPFSGFCYNDIGPVLPKKTVNRIHAYVAVEITFKTPEEALTYTTSLYTRYFGPFVDEDFFKVRVQHLLSPHPKGYVLNYDRDGANTGLLDRTGSDENNTDEENITYWSKFDKMTKPLLIYRGENSDLVTDEIMSQLQQRIDKGMNIKILGWPQTGHIPPLYVEREFLPIIKFIENLL